MDSKNISAVHDFSQWEFQLARGKAKSLGGKYGFTEADLPDIEQELLLEIHLKRHTGDNWRRRVASRRTILSRVLDNRIRKIIEAARAGKRRVHMLAESLESPVCYSEAGEPLMLGDILDEDGVVAKWRCPARSRPGELSISLKLKADKFSRLQLRIINLFMAGHSVTETAGVLGMPRTTLGREIARMRQLLRREGLAEYL